MKPLHNTVSKVALGAFALGVGTCLVVAPVPTAKSAPGQAGPGDGTRPARRSQAGRNGSPPGSPNGGPDNGPPGPPGPPPCGPPPDQLGDQLHLTAAQQTKIRAAMDKQRTAMRRIQEETRQAINGILTPEQLQQLRQIHDDACPPPPDGGPNGPPPDGNGPPPDDGNGPPPRDGHGPPPGQ